MNIIKNYDKYQNNNIFVKHLAKKIKLVKGNEEKVLDIYIPLITLFELDEHYFECMVSDKWKSEEFSYGLDEIESFRGFEQFIRDYLVYPKDKYHDQVKLHNDELSKYYTALRFNKTFIYDIDIKDFDMIPDHLQKLDKREFRIWMNSSYKVKISTIVNTKKFIIQQGFTDRYIILTIIDSGESIYNRYNVTLEYNDDKKTQIGHYRYTLLIKGDRKFCYCDKFVIDKSFTYFSLDHNNQIDFY